ncbi:ABC transporter ATP-binding protein [Burkholderia anthina]|uniref:ABC transporter ATP-binding protein n=1 Tax=Burkholderia anthina TaxID=179879 RepID=UPI00158E2F8B|nr:ABC transporter ATP-binding protein [Burkholderia anthina]MBY4865146.1 ABC transporter ATP-binding protein [Burkholderia anthina]
MKTPSDIVLDIRDLTISLPPGGDRSNAVEGLSLSVRRGELVCVVGESGSGKSVTAFATMGLLPKNTLVPKAGSIRLQGESLLEASPSRIRALRGQSMGMVFQEPMTALNPVQAIGEQIEEVLRIHSRMSAGQRKARVLEIMKATHLPDPDKLYHSYPHQLSGGQRQRVVIAAAMVLGPSLLIADEPTTALDVTTQSQILKLIKELQKDTGMGVLFITHDFGVVADIADHVVVMQKGQIVERGTVKEILSTPQHPYTRALIEAVPASHPPKKDAPNGALVLQVEKLSMQYGSPSVMRRRRAVKAADDINFALRHGETIGIVGESGSGKSTVARCIARLLKPTDGKIKLGDKDVARLNERQLRPHRRRIQIVFQDPYRSLNPRRTILDSIIEGPLNYGKSKEAATMRAIELMALVRLPVEALQRYPHQFSGGQRQRIAIARALAMDPDVLIADEAVSALDVSVQQQVLQLLDEAKSKFKLAILFITHDLRVAAQISDNLIVMKNGRVVESGATYDVFKCPQNGYTRTLLEASPGKEFDVITSAASAH